MKTTLIMVRHSESPYIFGKERSRELSAKGKEAANKVKEILAEHKNISIVSSPYTRAVQTVQPLAEWKGLSITEYEELRERPIKGLNYKLEERELVKAIQQSFVDKNFCLEGGESTAEAQSRAIPVIHQLLKDHQGKTVVIGTHGNIMTIMLNYFDESFGFDFWHRTSKPDIYELSFFQNNLVRIQRLWQHG